MTFKDLAKKRRSIRTFTEQPVSGEQRKQLMTVALMSPTGKNCRAWEFVIVDDKDKLQILSECKDGDRVLIVSHGSYCLHMLKPLFGIDPVKFREERSENGAFPVPNGGIMKFEWADGSWKMLELPTEPEKFHD